jgi:cobalt/nickel transport system permease protein
MRWVDRFAYSNHIRLLDPAYKAGFSLFVLLMCLGIDQPVLSAILMASILLLATFWAGLPAGFFIKLLTVEASFLAIGVASIAISINTVSTPGSIPVGPFWLNVTPSTLYLAFKLLMRSLGCASAMNFLALTTPVVDLIELGRRIHLPELLIDLMSLIYRFIFTLLDCLDRMVIAQEVRLGFNGTRNSLRSAAQIGANLFIEAFQKSKKLEVALEGRGWNGSLRVLPQKYEGLFWLKEQIFPVRKD